MTKSTSCLFLATLLAVAMPATLAQAQLTRTFVSAANGNDANDCDRLTPCRFFQTAHDKTSDQGEIIVLDPGGYGSLTITKSISIVHDGIGEASIQPVGGTGITVNAGATGRVNLRGITIQGQGTGSGSGTGLRFNSGFALTITNCVVRNHGGNGIEFFPAGSSSLALSNTLVADNGQVGIWLASGAAGTTSKAVVSRVVSSGNRLEGIIVGGTTALGTINVVVTDSVAANNGRTGVGVVSFGDPNSLMVTRSAAISNGIGVRADALGGHRATLWVGRSTITNNAISWQTTGDGILRSFADNLIIINGDGNPAPTTLPMR